MSEYPEDIMKVASELNYMRSGPSSMDIAAAIYAERERCNAIVLIASVVESGDVRNVLDNVSEAIMKGDVE